MNDSQTTPSNGTSRRLPHKRARAAAEYVGRAKGNMAEAMRLAGYSEKTALHQATRLLNDPQVRAEIARLMDRYELTDAFASLKHSQLLDAQHFVKTDEGLREVADNSTQMRALTLYYKMQGRLWQRHCEIASIVEYWTGVVRELVEKHVPDTTVRIAIFEELEDRLVNFGKDSRQPAPLPQGHLTARTEDDR